MENIQADKNSVLFIELVFSFSSLAMQHIGKTANPRTGKIERNLNLAQSTIDKLVMLKEKTVGNLTMQEQNVIDTTLSNLQFNYLDEVEFTKKMELYDR
ncbi:DUF1844 domain-containing protein [Candidatus Poribacteria bacterium]|nr:DUF1844 domain-containing protein [Candidatus Poribacteria bacterium]